MPCLGNKDFCLSRDCGYIQFPSGVRVVRVKTKMSTFAPIVRSPVDQADDCRAIMGVS